MGSNSRNYCCFITLLKRVEYFMFFMSILLYYRRIMFSTMYYDYSDFILNKLYQIMVKIVFFCKMVFAAKYRHTKLIHYVFS